jgi:hypothetical protein
MRRALLILAAALTANGLVDATDALAAPHADAGAHADAAAGADAAADADADADAAAGADAGAGAAAVTDAGAITDAAAATAAGGSTNGCVESIPKGAERPTLTETFPLHGTSGWAATLAITIKHGKGERVLPAGLDLSNATEMKKVLDAAGFAVPEQDASASARLWTDPDDKASPVTTTHLDLPVVLLPKKAGRAKLDLPAFPVAIARANGEITTVCTRPHSIIVEDPIADVPDAQPKPNPPPRPQREEWTAMKKLVEYGSAGLLAGLAVAWIAYKIATRPKAPVPPPPPRPPWEIALEKLDEVRHAGLLDVLRYGEYFDRVSDAVRGYLGARFGFDGLESTTDEILTALRKQGAGFVHTGGEAELLGAPAPGIPIEEIARFLRECDLVKFANLTPTEEQCAAALAAGERIVRATMPVSLPTAVAPASASASASASATASAAASASAPPPASAPTEPQEPAAAAPDAPRAPSKPPPDEGGDA